MKLSQLVIVCVSSAVLSCPCFGQIAIVRNRVTSETAAAREFRVSNVDVNADIKEQVATVQIAQTFQNISKRTLETQFLFPLPEGAAINGLTLIVDGKELTGELKPKGEARQIYEEIVRRQRDPALLEYMDRGLFKTSVFPIPAGQTRRVEIRYTQLLNNDSGIVDFTLPLGLTRHSQKSIEKMSVTVRVKSNDELKNIYSPTHSFKIDRPDENRATRRLTLNHVREPDDVRLLYGTRGSDIGINLVTYQPEKDQQGYFLLLATPRVKAQKNTVIPKTVLFVVDRSGSMSGEKIKQAKASLVYMINSLRKHDTFNVISYSSEVELFRPELELVTDKTRKAALRYVDDIYSGGGTNINAALTTALGQLKDSQRPNYVLFLTDGLPTIGVKGEKEISENVTMANKVKARVFSFGVGFDVNSRLLDRLSRDQRGTSVYVKPEEDIEVAASSLFKKVSAPAMTDLKIRFINESHKSGKLVNRMSPGDLPDLFRGEQLIIVGRYKKSMPVTVELTGVVADKSQSLTLDTRFGDSASTRRNGFVESLWATRRIGEIIDQLDLNGQNKELVDELVALSLQHGIMTPYTSFLAEENVSLNDRSRLLTEAQGRSERGLSMASGRRGFVQREFKKSLQNSSLSAGGSDSGKMHTSQFGLQATVPQATGGLGGGGFGYGGRQSGANTLPGLPAGKASAGLGLITASDLPGRVVESETAPKRRRIKRVSTRTFYWKNNEWQDSVLATLDKKPEDKDIIKVVQFSDEYFALTKIDKGRYSKFLTMSEPVLIHINGKTYRIVPPKSDGK